jgi:hypothetical protein
MGIPVMILGESGSGKSTSLRNFKPEDVSVFNVASKPLPFRGKLPSMNGAGYPEIFSVLQKPTKRAYVIDDSQYLMAFTAFDRAKETGYQKFTDMAMDVYNLIQFIIRKTPPDLIVYFLHHPEVSDTGRIKAKTLGKMIDNQLTLEGLFSIVLMCRTDGTRHWFDTQSDGYNTCKSPMGLFDREIDNDLKLVDTKIREYYFTEETPNETN